MNEFKTAVSLIDWESTLICAGLIALILIFFTVAFIRILKPKDMKVLVRCSAFLIGLFMLIQALLEPSITRMDNSIYAALALIIAVLTGLVDYLYDLIVYFFWNHRADKLNRK